MLVDGILDVPHGRANILRILRGIIVWPNLIAKGYVLEIYIGAVYDVVFDPRIGSVLALCNARKVLIRDPNHDPNVGAGKWRAEILDWSINSQIFDVVLGLDRLRVEGPNSLEGDRSKSGATGCHCSVIQCSRSVEANNERQASLVNSTSGSKRGNSNVSKFNDDNSSWKSSLGQTHRIAFIWREKEFSRSLETTADGYVSPLDKSMEGALMVEGTSLVVRREKMANFIIYSADLGSEPQQEKCTNRILGEALGPTFILNRCRELLDSGTRSRPNFGVLRLKRFAGFRPKNTKTKHSKAMIVKTTASRNMHSQSLFMEEHQAIVKPREVRTESQGNNADLVNT
ncbi:hypothetical protein Ancab_031077, partial [Ancistrocladus abbreviatus]